MQCNKWCHTLTWGLYEHTEIYSDIGTYRNDTVLFDWNVQR